MDGCCGRPVGFACVRALDAEDTDRLATMFKALGDPARLRMMSMIAAVPELCVCELTPAFDLSSATVSHHLKALREAGLVDAERRGTFVFYRVRPGALEALGVLLGPTRLAGSGLAERAAPG